MDFRNWLISMGRDVFAGALADPESLVGIARAPGVEDVFFEEFGSAPYSVLEERGEESVSDLETRDLLLPEEPVGEKWVEEELARRFPRLWSAFGPKSEPRRRLRQSRDL